MNDNRDNEVGTGGSVGPVTTRQRRGPYRKGLERREQILETALSVFAEYGDRGTSLQEIADRVGVTQPALLHYFGSREELLLAILQRRDELGIAIARRSDDPIAAATESVRRKLDEPGIIKLFVALSAAATDPGHHAHSYFVDRYRTIGTSVTRSLEDGKQGGWVREDVPVEHMARLLLAVIDGLQVQWLMDSSIDMTAMVDTFVAMCSRRTDPGGDQD